MLYTYCNYRYFGSMAYGTVSHPFTSRDMGGRALIQYVDTAGEDHEFMSRAKTHLFYAPKKGGKIKIFFHKKEPQKAIVDSLLYYVLLPLVFLAVGCCFFIYAVLGRKNTTNFEARAEAK